MISGNDVHPPIKEIFIPERKKKSKAFYEKKNHSKHRKVSVEDIPFRSLISVTSLEVVLVIILKTKTVRRNNNLHSLPSHPCTILALPYNIAAVIVFMP